MFKLIDLKVSFFTKFCTAAFLSITPEYWSFKNLQKKRLSKNNTEKNIVQMPLKTVEIKGLNIRYAHEGDKDKPTIILLSPLPQSILVYTQIWGKLVSRYNVYAIDLLGCGMSDGNKEHMTFKQQGVFLENFIHYFKIENPHIVGPDVGMSTALYYACSRSNDIESLIIGDGPSINPSENSSVIKKLAKSRFWRFVFEVLGPEVLVYASANIGYINHYPTQAETDDFIASYKNRVPVVTEWFKNYSNSINDLDPKVDRLDKPTMIFWGENDIFLLPKNAINLNNRIRNSKMKIFKDCGHFIYQDKDEEFAEMLIDWVDGGYKQFESK